MQQTSRLALYVGLASALGLMSCGDNGVTPPENGGTPTDSVPASLTISGGADVDIAATLQLSVQAANAAGQPVQAVVTWSSGDPGVATVDNNGLVAGVGRGTATIQAATPGASGTVVATHDVRVRIASILISPSDATLTSLNDTLVVSAEAKDAQGATVAGVPILFASSNTPVVTVGGTGAAVAVGNGTAEISATADDRAAQATVTVSQVALDLSLPGTVDTLTSLGDTRAYVATASDARGNAIADGFTWTATNPGVAGVSGSTNSVTATAVGNGTTTIRVERDGLAADATLVVQQQVSSVSVTPASASLLETLTRQLTASVNDARGNAVPGASVVWSSSDPGVATVNATGLVTGESAGTATITAAAEGRTGMATVTVSAVSLSNDVQPIFTANCAFSGCHAGGAPAQGMNLSSGQAFSNTVNVQSNQSPLLRIKPLEPDSSYLVHKIQGTQASVNGSGSRMPLGGAPLSQAQIDTVRAWVKKGASNN